MKPPRSLKTSQLLRELKRKLVEKDLTLSLAESCTGGKISSLISSQPGASEFFKGGVVVYQSEMKISLLGVTKKVVQKNQAVNKEVAVKMADGVKTIFKSDFSISTTGFAGPSGGNSRTPIGTVFIGISTPQRTKVFRFHARGSRVQIQKRASESALFFLLKELN